MLEIVPQRSVAITDLSAIAHNARILRAWTGKRNRIMAVVKANAYGHGMLPVARAAQTAGIAHFGVATVAEAAELRAGGIVGQIFTLSPFAPSDATALVRLDITPFVSSEEQLAALALAVRDELLPARCFLVVDTGMGREGLLPVDAHRFLWRAWGDLARVRVSGIATHFACADSEKDDDVTVMQRIEFAGFLTEMSARRNVLQWSDGRGQRGIYVSCDNSPAFLRCIADQRGLDLDARIADCGPEPEDWDASHGIIGSIVRAGLALYGIAPYPGANDGLPLRAALSWRAKITLVRAIPTGSPLGYGQTFRTTRDSRIATLASGYADGLRRDLSNIGSVLIRGRRAKIVGRVSMDSVLVDVTDLRGVAVGEWATIIGTDEKETITAGDIATICDTTPHEPTCNIGARVEREYINDATT